MEIADAFGDDVTPEEFFLEYLPTLHDERLDLFDRYSDTTLRFCVRLTDRDEAYTVELRSDGSDARRGEMIDFPVVTIEGSTQHWETVKRYAERAFERLTDQLREHPPPHRIEQGFLDDLERYDGVVDIDLAGENEGSMRTRLILNDYDVPPGARTVTLNGSLDQVDRVVSGELHPTEATRSMQLSGDLSLAFDLGGLLLDHFPGLDE
jgi:hypothetical protein